MGTDKSTGAENVAATTIRAALALTAADDQPVDLHRARAPWAQRRQNGRERRDRVPRSSHRGWTPPPGRVDPVAQLERANATRDPALVPTRVARMVASPFAYYRGAADMMAFDLASTPTAGMQAQLCGDAHCMNFGFYGSPTGMVVFDVNDFDETAIGPWSWDLKRLAVSLALAGMGNGEGARACASAVATAVRTYRTVAASFEHIGVADLWQVVIDDHSPLVHQVGANDPVFRRAFVQARRHNNESTLPKLTEEVDGVRRFFSRPPSLTRLAPDLADAVGQALEAATLTTLADTRTLLGGYHIVDMAQKVVGVGSVGTADYVVLLEGEGPADPLFLQIKQAVSSDVRIVTGGPAPVHEGERIVTGQRLMQAVSDRFLGWTTVRGVPFYVRQLKDLKGSMPLDTLVGQTLADYGSLCAAILAKAHARTSDPAVIAGYCGKGDVLDRAIADFALAYAAQVRSDHAELAAAVRSGRLAAATDASAGVAPA